MTIRHAARFWCAVCAALVLAGCGNLVELGPSGPPPVVYTLEPPARAETSVDAASRPAIAVLEPELSGALDTDGVAVRDAAHSLSYLAGGRWENRAPDLIQRYVARALDNGGALRAYRDGQSVAAPGYRLQLDVRAYEADARQNAGSAPRVRIAWLAVLTEAESGRVLDERFFEVDEPAAHDSSAAIIGAFDRGMNSLTGHLARWILEAVEADDS